MLPAPSSSQKVSLLESIHSLEKQLKRMEQQAIQTQQFMDGLQRPSSSLMLENDLVRGGSPASDVSLQMTFQDLE